MVSPSPVLWSAVAFIVIGLCPAPAQAGVSKQWISEVQIVAIHVQPQEGGNIYLELNKSFDSSCPAVTSAKAKRYVELDRSFPGFREQFTMLLSAFTAGKKLNIYVQACGNAYATARNTVVLR